jgi:hypothetical protein
MNEPRNHLPRDLQALRYHDALTTGDLETVSTMWEQASRDPDLERLLVEIDDALFLEEAGPCLSGLISRWRSCWSKTTRTTRT